ncbi:MAG: hypothetical protein M3P48_10645 [Actinomycetota bacterium]|nr:hypothetical protein [Actinomycetota bacterium]
MRVLLVLVFLALVLLAVVAVVVVAARAGASGGRSGRRELTEAQRRAAEAETFIDRLKELAWDHRDVDPALSTILIDEIRQFERKRREIDQ